MELWRDVLLLKSFLPCEPRRASTRVLMERAMSRGFWLHGTRYTRLKWRRDMSLTFMLGAGVRFRYWTKYRGGALWERFVPFRIFSTSQTECPGSCLESASVQRGRVHADCKRGHLPEQHSIAMGQSRHRLDWHSAQLAPQNLNNRRVRGRTVELNPLGMFASPT